MRQARIEDQQQPDSCPLSWFHAQERDQDFDVTVSTGPYRYLLGRRKIGKRIIAVRWMVDPVSGRQLNMRTISIKDIPERVWTQMVTREAAAEQSLVEMA